MANQLYYGDNLDILREHIPDESLDLIYLDPAPQGPQGALIHALCRWMVLCIAVVVLVGCTKAKEVYAPDGRQGHTIECSGEWRSWANCFQRASERAPSRSFGVPWTW